MSDGFVNLHVHSEYSLLDGMIKVDDLVKKTLEFNQIASVITDHGKRLPQIGLRLAALQFHKNFPLSVNFMNLYRRLLRIAGKAP